MTDQNNQTHAQTLTIGAADRHAMARRMTADFEAFLAPGERLSVQAEARPDYVYATLSLASPDDTERLDLEGVVVGKDFEGREAPMPPAAQALSLIVDYLRLHLHEFFRLDRQMIYTPQWLGDEYEQVPVRFRGSRRSPALEAHADELLSHTERAH